MIMMVNEKKNYEILYNKTSGNILFVLFSYDAEEIKGR